MSGVNKVLILGRLGQDPEVKKLEGGATVARLSIATSKKYKGKDGNPVEKTEWHRCVAWNRLAELTEKYLKKGRQVYVEGELQTRSWEKDGEKRFATEILVQSMQFVGDAPKGGSAPEGGTQDIGDPNWNADEPIPF